MIWSIRMPHKRAKAELAIDDLRRKFGDKAVELGLTFGDGVPQERAK